MLSIIVPIYNVVQYLRHCLQSLSEQGLEDYEVILVNDASRDNSMGICSEWCQDHPQFRLINHTVNQGLSAARNTGIAEARGEWITFVDSDDFVAPGTFGQIMNMVGDEKVIEYPIMQKHLSQHPQLLTFADRMIDFGEWLNDGGHLHCYACNKLFRREVWEGVSFPVGRHFEDIFTIPFVIRKAGGVRQLPLGMYYYCDRSGSISYCPDQRGWLDYVEAYCKLLELPEAATNHEIYLRARNGEIMYHRTSGTNNRIVPKRRIPFRYAFAKGLSFHDRLKVLWLWTDIVNNPG